jgi:hypothetical protein
MAMQPQFWQSRLSTELTRRDAAFEIRREALRCLREWMHSSALRRLA